MNDSYKSLIELIRVGYRCFMPWLARLSATTRTIEIKTNPLKLPTT